VLAVVRDHGAFLVEDDWAREQLRARRDLLMDSLRQHAPHAHIDAVPAGGLNLWAHLADGTDVNQVAQDCERAQVPPRGAAGALLRAQLRVLAWVATESFTLTHTVGRRRPRWRTIGTPRG
jgi:hypothetical protein